MQLELPYPPTVNTYWRRVILHGRPQTLISAKGRAYRKDVCAAVILSGLRGAPLSGRLAVRVYAYPPDRRERDLDNILKAPLDALTAAGVWLKDSQIDELSVKRCPIVPGGKAVITIEEAAE